MQIELAGPFSPENGFSNLCSAESEKTIRTVSSNCQTNERLFVSFKRCEYFNSITFVKATKKMK
jgi:hypothetical protein